MTKVTINDEILVQFMDVKCIRVNGETFLKTEWEDNFGELDFSIDLIKNNLPDNLKNAEFYSIFWDKNSPNDSGFNVLIDGYFKFDLTEENYNKYIKPYVDIWQQVKDKIDQEQAAAEEEYQKFTNRQIRAYSAINSNYADALKTSYVNTSLGYAADISAESTATLLGTKLNFDNGTINSTTFVDYHDINRNVNAEQLNSIISEINLTQTHLRNQKQDFIQQVKNTYDNDSLNAVLVQCKFTTLDFNSDVEVASGNDRIPQYTEIEIEQKDLIALVNK